MYAAVSPGGSVPSLEAGRAHAGFRGDRDRDFVRLAGGSKSKGRKSRDSGSSELSDSCVVCAFESARSSVVWLVTIVSAADASLVKLNVKPSASCDGEAPIFLGSLSLASSMALSRCFFAQSRRFRYAPAPRRKVSASPLRPHVLICVMTKPQSLFGLDAGIGWLVYIFNCPPW